MHIQLLIQKIIKQISKGREEQHFSSAGEPTKQTAGTHPAGQLSSSKHSGAAATCFSEAIKQYPKCVSIRKTPFDFRAVRITWLFSAFLLLLAFFCWMTAQLVSKTKEKQRGKVRCQQLESKDFEFITPKRRGTRDKETLQSTVRNPSDTDFASSPALSWQVFSNTLAVGHSYSVCCLMETTTGEHGSGWYPYFYRITEGKTQKHIYVHKYAHIYIEITQLWF